MFKNQNEKKKHQTVEGHQIVSLIKLANYMHEHKGLTECQLQFVWLILNRR